jgi:hypothetical protein
LLQRDRRLSACTVGAGSWTLFELAKSSSEGGSIGALDVIARCAASDEDVAMHLDERVLRWRVIISFACRK